MNEESYLRVIPKGVERYIFIYNDGEEEFIVEASRRLVDNPELNFYDDDVDCLAQIVCGEF